MEQVGGTRRAFVGGVIACGAALGALTVTRWGKPAAVAAANDDIVFRDSIPGFAPDPNEVAQWRQTVGQTYQAAGLGTMTLVAVTAEPAKGRRPATTRPAPFSLQFQTNPAAAPEADGTYDVVRSTGTVARMFLTRGADQLGKATLTAIFN